MLLGVLGVLGVLCAGVSGSTPSLHTCSVSGNWSEYWLPQGPGSADNQTNVFRQVQGSLSFSVSAVPAAWWVQGNGTLRTDDTVDMYFPHNPWPSGNPQALHGWLAGTCDNLFIFWENLSVWCMHVAGTGKCGAQPTPPGPIPPPPPPVSDIKVVHVVQSCHLDVGFADTEPNIINRYFDEHFPMAMQVAQQLRNDPTTNARLQFMAQSYVVSLYLDCPSGMELHCPNSTQRDAFIAALKRGDITYHAFPFNSELELYDPSFITEGIALTHSLDEMLGLAPKATLSQRDVPGTTRSIIPILKKAGVNSMSVGVNGASGYPLVPKIFTWLDPVSSESIVAMWHPRGYGGIDVDDAVMIPGFSHALVFDWNGDNAGPYDANTYKQHFQQIQASFPNAQVVSSTFDNFTSLLTDSIKATLPVITNEIGDTWIHGCPSDPRKLANMRAMNRVWSAYLSQGGKRDAVYLNATRLALKCGEHTWGLDVKSNLQDNADWSNSDFEYARTQGPYKEQFGVLEEDWWRQRAWSYGFAFQALQNAQHPLADMLQAEWDQITADAPNPAASGFQRVANPQQVFTCGIYSVGFDSTGALTTLRDNSKGLNWASSSNPLLSLQYQTYSQQDFVNFIETYTQLTNPPDWALHDFGKPNDTVSQHLVVGSQLVSLWSKSNSTATEFLVEIQILQNMAQVAGAPQRFWIDLTVPFSSGVALDAKLLAINKTSTRLPESMFFRFVPPFLSLQSSVQLDKLGEWIDISEVVDGGSKHIHGVSSGFRLTSADNTQTLLVETIDAGVVCVGEPTGFPTPLDQEPDVTQGVGAMLWNNLWGTNYIMWWPFNQNYEPVPDELNSSFRFKLHLM